MTARIACTAVVCFVTAIAACQSDSPSLDQGKSDLIGGHVGQSGEFPATLTIVDNCTATRVGPREILTAAHCVFQQGMPDNVRSMYQRGQTVRVMPTGNGSIQAAVVDHVVPHLKFVASPIINCDQNLTAPVIDVAVIHVRDPLPDTIAIASVDTRSAQADDIVTMAGSGCETSVRETFDYTLRRHKFGETSVIATPNLRNPNGLWSSRTISDSQLSLVDSVYFITPGPDYVPPGPGLCPGDSGGPIYRNGHVIGVNASYVFKTVGQPYTNLFTRFSSPDVVEWLRTESVSLITTSASVVDSGAPVVDSGSPVVDSGSPVVDSGSPVIDSGSPVVDSGSPVVDSGSPVVDSGSPVVDSGSPVIDSGSPVVDSGSPVVDSGAPVVDSGSAWSCPATSCLKISEVVDSGSNKAVEVTNACATPIDLSRVSLCIENNTSTYCINGTGAGRSVTLTGTLAPGSAFAACQGFANEPACAQAAYLAFNGDDRIALRFDSVVVDSFGELGTLPASTPWTKQAFRRNRDCSSYLGVGPFSTSAYQSGTANASHLGIAP